MLKVRCKFILIILLLIVFFESNCFLTAVGKGVLSYQINKYETYKELGCYPDTPISFQNYIRSMYQKIERSSNLPAEDAFGKIELSFFVDSGGNVSNVLITKSSGKEQSDKAAIEAVRSAAPFGTFPIDFKSSGIKFNFAFFLKPVEISNNMQNVTPIIPLPPPNTSTTPVVPTAPYSLSNPYLQGTGQISANSTIVPIVGQNTTSMPVNTQKVTTIYPNLNQNASSNFVRHPKNPMKYDYNPQYGNYFKYIENCLNCEGISVMDYHFQQFPIKYWIQPVDPTINRIIRDAINDYAYYLPMVEVSSQPDADIVFELSQNISADYRTMGKAGLEYPTLKGNVSLSPSIFSREAIILAKLTVKHEIAHALGLIKHSDDINDLMYPQQKIDATSNPNKAKVIETGQIKTYEDFGRFSFRDLNTLWMLYNQWL